MKIYGDNLGSVEDYKVVRNSDYTIKLKEVGEGEKVSIISDVMFKTMFQNSKRIKYSAKLISYFIDVSYEKLLENLRLVQNDFNNEKYYSKGERGDYVAEIDGVNINIEINNNYQNYTFERNLEYIFRIYTKNVVKSRRKSSYKYIKVIQINFNNFYYEEDNDSIKLFTINDGKVKYTDKIIIVQVYLPLLRKKWYTLGIQNLDEKEKFILSLYEMNISNSKKLGGKIDIMNDYLEEAEEVMDEITFGESYDKELSTYEGGFDEGRLAGYDDGYESGREDGYEVGKKEGYSNGREEGYNTGKEEGYNTGKEEGYNTGKEEGYNTGKEEGYNTGKEEGYNTGQEELKRDVVANLLKNNVALEIISDVTGYSISELKNLKKEI